MEQTVGEVEVGLEALSGWVTMEARPKASYWVVATWGATPLPGAGLVTEIAFRVVVGVGGGVVSGIGDLPLPAVGATVGGIGFRKEGGAEIAKCLCSSWIPEFRDRPLHGKPMSLWVVLQPELPEGPGVVLWKLVIRDDGLGFDPTAPAVEAGRGLRSFRERAAELDGRVEIVSAPGVGTRIQAIFPECPRS